MTYYLTYLLITELRFDTILYSKLTYETSDACHIKCSRGPQVPYPWSKYICWSWLSKAANLLLKIAFSKFCPSNFVYPMSSEFMPNHFESTKKATQLIELVNVM